MGLGKTVQTLALIVRAREAAAGSPPFLVVAPTSVVGVWQAEAARFAPGLDVRVVEATRAKRGTALADEVAGAHVVLTSYALLRLDADDYAGREWSGLIVDEAQSLERNVLLTVLSRIGANSKVVLTHDVAQRDNLRVGRHDGIVAVVEKLKGHPLFAHVTLTRSERSPIAALVTEMLENVTL